MNARGADAAHSHHLPRHVDHFETLQELAAVLLQSGPVWRGIVGGRSPATRRPSTRTETGTRGQAPPPVVD